MRNIVPQNRALKWALWLGFWTLLGLSFASQFYISSFKAGLSVTWLQAVGWALGDWYVFAILSIPVAALARRFPLGSPVWKRNVFLHLFASLIFSLVYILLRAAVGQVQGSQAGQSVGFSEAFQPLLFKTWHFNLLIYWVMVSVSHALDFYGKFQEKELRGAELERRLTEARLQALQIQLNPHFLFNTLHAISALMHKDVEAADRMLARLSDLLRHALESTDEQEVSLDQELNFLRRYLEIEQTRFGERLRVDFEIAPDALSAQVPNLILQPLVENAIRHGVEPHARAGLITICGRIENGNLRLEVLDNGNGPGPGKFEEGVGLSNTKARLQQLYGPGHSFSLGQKDGRGCRVEITIPFRA